MQLLLQLVTLRNLTPWRGLNLLPMCQLRSFATIATQLKSADHLVLRHPVPVQQHELQLDLSKPGLIARKIEDEGLVEDRVQRSLLHVRLFLRDPLTIVHQVDLHVRICKKYFRFLYIFLHFLLAILNVGLLEKRHWKQLPKKELHFS